MRTGQNIYKRRDGRWEARVFLGKKANGRPNFKYLYASTYREVLLQKNNYEKTISVKKYTTTFQRIVFRCCIQLVAELCQALETGHLYEI